jgi:hypothetical protein
MSVSVYPGSLDSFATNLADSTPMAVNHASHHDGLADAVNKIEAELGVNPKGGSATVAARLGLFVLRAGDTIGSGDEVDAQPSVALPGRKFQILDGTAGSPVTAVGPTIRVSKLDATTQASLDAVPGVGVGAQTIDHTAAIVGAIRGTAASQLQVTGLAGVAHNNGTSGHPDACAVLGHAWQDTAGAIGVAIGAYFAARVEAAASSSAGLTGIEIQAQNATGSDHSNSSTGAGVSRGLLISAGGSSFNRAACGIKFHHPTSWAKFDVGIHIASNDGGSILTTFIQDDGTSTNSILINGTHTVGIGVAAGAGIVAVGRTSTLGFSELFNVYVNGTGNPIAVFSGQGASDSISVMNRNGSGSSRWFTAGAANQYVTGTVAGDSGFMLGTAGNSFHIGGTGQTAVLTIQHPSPAAAGKLSFFGNAAVSKRTGWAAATGTATRTTFDTATVTLSQLAERVKALIDDFYSTTGYGLLNA